MSLYLGENLISGVATPIQGARNIGQIIQSTIPLTDAGLHLLDGALINGSGSYADFVTYIAGLVSTYPDLFETEVNWQTSVTNYGVCGKFVYDSVNNTVRLPKVTGIIEGTTDVTALGDLVEAGLPNITGMFECEGQTTTANNSFYTSWDKWGVHIGNEGAYTKNITFDASRSNTIYGNSSTVQPQTIKAFVYIVIANSTKTSIQVDIDQIVTDLNGKADTDLSNCTKPHIVETYNNGTSWYRVYSDGWCEQGGRAALNETATTTITLLKPYKNTDYSVSAVSITASTAGDTEAGLQCTPISTTKITLTAHYLNPNNQTACWQACGYI